MCRLFGFRSHIPQNAHHSLVEAENALMVQSQAHRDGWGLAFFEARSPRLYKGTSPAFQDESYEALSRSLSSHSVIAHVRQATIGNVCEYNTHPFQFQNWIFAHNGTVYGFPQLRPYFLEEIPAHLRACIRGNTDSEHCFFLFLAELESFCDLDQADADSVDEALAATLQKIASWCRLVGIRQAPCMNFLITNGEIFAASRLGRDLFFSTQKFTYSECGGGTDLEKHCLGLRSPGATVTHLLVASERISTEELWEEVPDNSTLLVDGTMRFRLRRNVASLANLEFAPMPASLNGPAIAS